MYLYVMAAAVLYLLFDVYLSVKSLPAILRSVSFYMAACMFAVLNLLTYGFLSILLADKVKPMIGSGLTPLLLIVLSTLGMVSVGQSLTLKLGGEKWFDLGKIVENFRNNVLTDSMRHVARTSKRRALKAAKRLMQCDEETLKNTFLRTMNFGGQTKEEILEQLEDSQQFATKAGVSLSSELANRIAALDVEEAESMVEGKS